MHTSQTIDLAQQHRSDLLAQADRQRLARTARQAGKARRAGAALPIAEAGTPARRRPSLAWVLRSHRTAI